MFRTISGVHALRFLVSLDLPLRLGGALIFGALSGLAASNACSAAPTADAAARDVPILQRHADRGRSAAADWPRSEDEQAIVDGWPLYRTARGQQVFNQAMATLEATAGPAPAENLFTSCPQLDCKLQLPAMTPDGWLPPGRLWLGTKKYILIVRSPRDGHPTYMRRPRRHMRVFVFHEFRNGTRNTDLYDTISSHRGNVFTPFYLSTPRQDASGKQFVVLVQVAPHDVASRHAANHANRGPGIEVAKNHDEALSPLQARAGIVIATFMKEAIPSIRAVHHRGTEGRAMLRAYLEHRKSRKARLARLPFTRASQSALSTARASLHGLVHRDRKKAQPVHLARDDLARDNLIPPRPVLVSRGTSSRSTERLTLEAPHVVQADVSLASPRQHRGAADLLRHLAALARNVRW